MHIVLADASQDGQSISWEGGLVDWATPEFRTVSTPVARKGLRLERAFWSALGTISESMGLKRSKLIAELLEEAGEHKLNTASALRSFAVHSMAEELERVRALNEASFAVSLLQQAPVPSFAINRSKRLIRVNGEFNHFIHILFADGDSAGSRGVQINLETPLAQIFEDLGTSGESRACMMDVLMGTRVRRIRTKLVAVPPHDPTVLVGYVIP
jgi:predicted DNA-binding ribbon-helix-helix protein